MDEPTTHLDMASIDALVSALDQYEGTLIFISHDVHFIRALAKKVLHIDTGKLTPYAGDYDYYLEKSRATDERAALDAGNAPAAPVVTAAPAASDLNAPVTVRKTKEQKRAEAELRNVLSRERREKEERVRALERQINELETKQKKLAAELEEESVYDQPGRPQQLNRELTGVTGQLERLTREWETVAEQVQAEPPVEAAAS